MSAPPSQVRPWRNLTPARIGLGRTGVSQTTDVALQFALDHARARDAVHRPMDVDRLRDALGEWGRGARTAASQATDRTAYLARPDLGARLDPASAAAMTKADGLRPDLAIVLADGLSSLALDHAPALLDALIPALTAENWRLAPLVIARQARVALGDEIGAGLDAAMVLVLIGERPGLSAVDSLGAYLTWSPRPGRTNAERNCVSNIRPQGLPPADAARTLHWLLTEARRRRLTGVLLKEQSELTSLEAAKAKSDPTGSDFAHKPLI